jgi:tetratricopeptide (TPR) repeat protein
MQASEKESFATLFARVVEHHLQGRVSKALSLYDTIVRDHPDAAAAHCNRGLALQSLNQPDAALQSYDRAITLDPRYADAHYNMAILLRNMNRLSEAVESYDRTIKYNPGHAEAWSNRGNVLRALGRTEEALESFDRAIALRPVIADTHYNRGNALQDLRRWHEAVASYGRAVAIMPDFAEAWCNRSNALRNLGRPDEALENSNRAIALRPSLADVHTSRGNSLKDLKRLWEAIESYDRAIKLDRHSADAHWNKGLCVLMTGDLAEGWRLYEWRKKAFDASKVHSGARPVWSGQEPLEDRTLLVYADEQGLGDTIQFCRYAVLARQRGARVILAAQDRLVAVLRSIGETIEVVKISSAIPAADFQIALLSMPLAFETTLHNIPATVPYLAAERDRVARWRAMLGDVGFKVGICWRASPVRNADTDKSFPLRFFERIAAIPGVRLISLQKHDGLAELQNLPAGMRVETLGDGFDDGHDAFLDTAAVMENLDLVIAPDTAVAHLAGALARPIWVALKFVPDWRWLLDRSDSPWYPTMKLFRQERHGDWSGVFPALETELRARLDVPASG